MPFFLETFLSFPHNIQRADAIRYVILYLYGGIYLDLDYVSLNSFDALLPADILLMKSKHTNHLTNSFMASRSPGHSFWMDCIKQMMITKMPSIFGKHLTVFNTTGPFLLHKVYLKTKSKYNIVIDDNIVVPCTVCTKHCNNNYDYILKPIKGSSWHSWDSKFYNFCFCYWKHACVVAILIFFIYKCANVYLV